MTNKFVQHIPAFVYGIMPSVFEFSTQEELEKKLKELGYATKEGAWIGLCGHLIMEVYDEGNKWWVAGMVETRQGLEFPEWKSKYLNLNSTNN